MSGLGCIGTMASEVGVTLFDMQDFDVTARYRGSFSSDARTHGRTDARTRGRTDASAVAAGEYQLLTMRVTIRR